MQGQRPCTAHHQGIAYRFIVREDAEAEYRRGGRTWLPGEPRTVTTFRSPPETVPAVHHRLELTNLSKENSGAEIHETRACVPTGPETSNTRERLKGICGTWQAKLMTPTSRSSWWQVIMGARSNSRAMLQMLFWPSTGRCQCPDWGSQRIQSQTVNTDGYEWDCEVQPEPHILQETWLVAFVPGKCRDHSARLQCHQAGKFPRACRHCTGHARTCVNMKGATFRAERQGVKKVQLSQVWEGQIPTEIGHIGICV